MTANGSDNGGKSDIVSLSEAAARLGKSERTVRRMVTSGKLNAVEIGGRTCVQFAGVVTPPARDIQADNDGANAVTNGGTLSDPIIDILKDTIHRQDGEISFLRNELTATRTTLETVTRMLPAPAKTQDQARRQVWPWILAVVVILAGVGGYLLWLTK